MAFLFASPLLDPVVLGVLIFLVGVEGTVAYAVLTFSASVLIGALFARLGLEKDVKLFPAAARPGGRIWGNRTGRSVRIDRREGTFSAPPGKSTQRRPSMSATRSAADTAIQVGVIVLTLIAAAVHLSLLFPDPAFILNGLGYLTLLAALYLPIPQLVPYRRVVRVTLMGYATLTILLWVAIGERSLLGFSTTADEVALVILLLLESRRMRSLVATPIDNCHCGAYTEE